MSVNDRDRLSSLVAEAKKRGADAADAVLIRSTSLSHAQRLGEIEKLERQETLFLSISKRGLCCSIRGPFRRKISSEMSSLVTQIRTLSYHYEK